MIRFHKNAKIFDIGIAAVAGIVSVGAMVYGVFHYGLKDTWPELVLNLFYIACLVMIGLYFFNRLDTHRFNYWCSIFVGITVLLRVLTGVSSKWLCAPVVPCVCDCVMYCVYGNLRMLMSGRADVTRMCGCVQLCKCA